MAIKRVYKIIVKYNPGHKMTNGAIGQMTGHWVLAYNKKKALMIANHIENIDRMFQELPN